MNQQVVQDFIQEVLKKEFKGNQSNIDYIQSMLEELEEEGLNNEIDIQNLLGDYLLKEVQGFDSLEKVKDFSQRVYDEYLFVKKQFIIKKELTLNLEQNNQSQGKQKQYYREEIEEIEQNKILQQQAEKHGCLLCERIIPLTFHHLIPRMTHDKPYNKDKTKQFLNKGIWICRDCHSGIHNIIEEELMAQQFNTLELLLKHPQVHQMAKYMNKQKINFKQDSRILDGKFKLITHSQQ